MYLQEITELSRTLTVWADPWWFVWTSGFLMVICAIAPLPLRLDHHELTTRQAAVILLRRVTLGGIIGLIVFFSNSRFLCSGGKISINVVYVECF